MPISPLLYPFFAAILWGTLFILIKDTKTPSIYGIGISLLGGVLFLSLPVFILGAPVFLPIIEPRIMLMIAIVGVARYILGTLFFYESIKIGDISVATPIIGSKILIVSVLSVILGIETVDKLLVVAILLAGAGFVAITLHIRKLEKLHRMNLVRCVVFALGASLCWAGADIFVKKMGDIDPLMITFGSLFFSLLLYYTFIFSLKRTRVVFNIPSFDKKRYFLHGIFSLAIAYLLLNLSLVKLGIIKTNIVIALWPVFASFIGYNRYREIFFFSKVCGAIMLIISFVLVALS